MTHYDLPLNYIAGASERFSVYCASERMRPSDHNECCRHCQLADARQNRPTIQRPPSANSPMVAHKVGRLVAFVETTGADETPVSQHTVPRAEDA